jgi:hypothetical protein
VAFFICFLLYPAPGYKANGQDSEGFPPSQEIAGLSSPLSQDGGMDFTVSSLHESHMAHVHTSGPFLITKTASIKAIPRAVGEVLFAGMALRSDMFAMNRAFLCGRLVQSMELTGEEGTDITDTRIHAAIPKAVAIMLLNICWSFLH